MTSGSIPRETTLAIVELRDRRLLVACDGSGLRRPRLSDWRALASATPAAPQSHAAAALRRAMRAWQIDREMCGLVTNPRDTRLTRRREADAQLILSGTLTRALQATTVSRSREASRFPRRRQPAGGVHRTDHVRLCVGITLVPEA
jgi:hypothetical protein